MYGMITRWKLQWTIRGRRNSKSRLVRHALISIWIGSLLAGVAGAVESSMSVDGQSVSTMPEESFAPPSPQKCASPVGPALAMPREVLDLLNQRKQALDRREESVRTAEARLKTLRDEMEGMLGRYEQAVKAAETKRQDMKYKQAQAEQAAYQATLTQVVKMYETMPPEEAALRIEKVSTDMALQVLRSLKGKTAGAILSQVKPDKAAKLTEQLMTAPAKKAPADR